MSSHCMHTSSMLKSSQDQRNYIASLANPESETLGVKSSSNWTFLAIKSLLNYSRFRVLMKIPNPLDCSKGNFHASFQIRTSLFLSKPFKWDSKSLPNYVMQKLNLFFMSHNSKVLLENKKIQRFCLSSETFGLYLKITKRKLRPYNHVRKAWIGSSDQMETNDKWFNLVEIWWFKGSIIFTLRKKWEEKVRVMRRIMWVLISLSLD